MTNQGHIELGSLPEEPKLLSGQLFEREIVETEVKDTCVDLLNNLRQPFPDQTPKQILERWYQIETKVMDSTPIAVTRNPIALLMAIPTIAQVLASFVFFRADVEVMFFFESSPTVYGTIMVCADPGEAVTSGAFDSSVTSFLLMIASADPLIIDVAEKTNTTLRLPWISPSPFLPIWRGVTSNLSEGLLNPCGYAIYYSSVADIANSTSQAVKVVTRARFVNPVAVAHRLYGTALTTSPSVAGIEAQMQAAVTNTVIAGVGAVASEFVYQKAKKAYFGSGAHNVVGKADSAIDPSGKKKIKAKMAPIAEPQVGVKQNVFGDMVRNTVCEYPLSEVTTEGGLENPLYEVLKKPSLIGAALLDSSGFAVLIHPMSQTMGRANRLAFYSKFFRLWRGSMNLSLRFVSSPLMTYRVGVNLQIGNTGPVPSSDGDLPTKYYTIRGTTDICVNIPYVFQNEWSHCDYFASQFTVSPTVTVWLDQSPVSALPVTSVILPYYAWISAGPDFEFTSLKNCCPSNSEDIQAQMHPSDITARVEPFYEGSTLPAPVWERSIDTVESIGKRWQALPPLCLPSATCSLPYVKQTDVSFQYLNNASQLSRSWLFSMGEMDYKAKVDQTIAVTNDNWVTLESTRAVAGSNGPDPTRRVADGMVILNSGFGNVLEFTAPFLSGY